MKLAKSVAHFLPPSEVDQKAKLRRTLSSELYIKELEVMRKRRRSTQSGGPIPRSLLLRLQALGAFISDLLMSSALLVALLLLEAGLTVFIETLRMLTEDGAFLIFAELMHIFLMCADGFLFIWVVLYWTVRAINGGKDE
jgi:hypothetical protein